MGDDRPVGQIAYDSGYHKGFVDGANQNHPPETPQERFRTEPPEGWWDDRYAAVHTPPPNDSRECDDTPAHDLPLKKCDTSHSEETPKIKLLLMPGGEVRWTE